MPVPHTSFSDWSSLHPRPGRLAHEIRTDSPRDCQVALLGVPDDTGVTMTGGRAGARDGPRAFRRALAAYGCDYDAVTGRSLGDIGIYDAGDVNAAGDEMHHTHDRVTDAVRAILDLGLIPVCIGGGHDLTYPGVRALYRALREDGDRLGGINIGPHLEVRERAGSGMTYRRILEDGEGVVDPANFAAIGLGPFANRLDHLEWAREKKARLIFFEGDQHDLFDRFEETIEALRETPNLFASFDLDMLDASVAPGVSSLNPMGLTPVTASLMARRIGALENLRYFDLMELSPPHDIEDRTARLAAHLFLSFLSGLAERLDGDE
ncbi:MAG: formimidoylglutamase [Phycisphaerales bacterium]